MAIAPLFGQIKSLGSLEEHTSKLEKTTRFPVLFIGHGSPMNAIEENEFVDGFRNIVTTFSKPSAIVCISAHWYVNGTRLTAMPLPRTIYDFGGFPKELYEVKYPAIGNPLLAKEVVECLKPESALLDFKWGLDHGSWTVLKHLYPLADVPIIQLSIDYNKSPQWHFDLAKKLSYMRERGVLFVGSGNIVHNLSLVDFQNFNKDNYGFDWALEARTKINNLLINNEYKRLIEYKSLGNSVQLAIPTPDHFLPLIYALGLKNNDEPATFFNDKMVAGSLSMTSVKFG